MHLFSSDCILGLLLILITDMLILYACSLTGWGVADEPVYLGMIVLTIWIIILLIMTCIGMQIKKS